MNNAERQRRYRERLKAEAAGVNLPEKARETISEALRITWSMAADYGLDEFQTYQDYVAWIYQPRKRSEHRPGSAADLFRQLFSEELEDATPEDREVLQRAIDLIDAVTLRPALD